MEAQNWRRTAGFWTLLVSLGVLRRCSEAACGLERPLRLCRPKMRHPDGWVGATINPSRNDEKARFGDLQECLEMIETRTGRRAAVRIPALATRHGS